MVVRQGDVVWVALGEPVGSAPGFRRPCVVVQNDLFNASKIRTVVVCPITSNVRRAALPGNVKLARGEANLPKPSVALGTQLITVDLSQVISTIGTISKKRLKDVLDGIFLVLEPHEPSR